MAKRVDVLILEKSDLTREGQKLPFSQVTYSSIRGGIDKIQKEDLVLYLGDNGKMKELKNRWGVINRENPKTMKNKLLCFLGFHKWKNIDPFYPDPIKGEMVCFSNLHECENCEKQEYKGMGCVI